MPLHSRPVKQAFDRREKSPKQARGCRCTPRAFASSDLAYVSKYGHSHITLTPYRTKASFSFDTKPYHVIQFRYTRTLTQHERVQHGGAGWNGTRTDTPSSGGERARRHASPAHVRAARTLYAVPAWRTHAAQTRVCTPQAR